MHPLYDRGHRTADEAGEIVFNNFVLFNLAAVLMGRTA
jgi:hypothetical protein